MEENVNRLGFVMVSREDVNRIGPNLEILGFLLMLHEMASYQDEPCHRIIQNKHITYYKGETPASFRFLGKRTGLHRNKVGRILDDLRQAQIIETRQDKGITIVKVKFLSQQPGQKSGQHPGHQAGQLKSASNPIQEGILEKPIVQNGTASGTPGGTLNRTQTGTKSNKYKKNNNNTFYNPKKNSNERDGSALEKFGLGKFKQS